MKCTNCGSEIAPNQAFCSTCGTPVPRQVNQVQGGAVNQNLGGQGFPPPPPQKKGGVPIWVFLITILLIVAILLGVYFLVLRDSDSDDDSSSSSSSSRKKNDSDDEDDDDNKSSKNNTTNNTSNNTANNSTGNNTYTPPSSDSGSSFTVAVGGFTVKVPDNYIYQVSDNMIKIGDENDTILIHMMIQETPYSSIVSRKDELASKIRTNGATVSKVEEKTINGTQCIAYEVTEAGQNYVLAVVRVNSMYTAVCEVINADYTTYDYNALGTAVSIATTAEKSSSTTTTPTAPSSNNNNTTTNLESKTTIDIKNILE